MLIFKRMIIFIIIFVPVIFVFILIIPIIKSLAEKNKSQKKIIKKNDYRDNIKHYYETYKHNWFRHLLSTYYAFDFKISPEDRRKILSGFKKHENPPRRIGAIADFDFIPISDRDIAEKNLQSIVSEETNFFTNSVKSVKCIRFLNDYFKNLAGLDALNKTKQFVPDSSKSEWQKTSDKLLKEKKILIDNLHINYPKSTN